VQQNQTCTHGPCPVHCLVGQFSVWSHCSMSCGPGAQSRSRSIIAAAAHDGYVCPYLEETRVCTDRECPEQCVVSAFSAWSTCEASCGRSSQSRTRSIVSPNRYGGYECPYLREVRTCAEHSCPQDCVIEDWAHGRRAPGLAVGATRLEHATSRTRSLVAQRARLALPHRTATQRRAHLTAPSVTGVRGRHVQTLAVLDSNSACAI
jgi:hypothetical protein